MGTLVCFSFTGICGGRPSLLPATSGEGVPAASALTYKVYGPEGQLRSECAPAAPLLWGVFPGEGVFRPVFCVQTRPPPASCPTPGPALGARRPQGPGPSGSSQEVPLVQHRPCGLRACPTQPRPHHHVKWTLRRGSTRSADSAGCPPA